MPDVKSPPLILASASPRRLQLLKQAGILPAEVIAPNLDETPHKGEMPDKHAERIAAGKAAIVAGKHKHAVILAADTVVACGRRILPKAEKEEEARKCLQLLSGRRHRVYTAVCATWDGAVKNKLVMTQVQFRRLKPSDIEAYIACGEWQGKAGGYAIQGCAETFIPWINGSYSNVVGLPLAETCNVLEAFGIRPPAGQPRKDN